MKFRLAVPMLALPLIWAQTSAEPAGYKYWGAEQLLSAEKAGQQLNYFTLKVNE